jgi:DNA-binding NarL/FixJ family response regulator
MGTAERHNNEQMTIRIAIAEDQRLVRELIATLLGREPDMVVVGEAASGRETLSMVHSVQPDVLVLDIGLPDFDGIDVARRLRKERGEDPKLIALSMHTEAHVVRAMLQAGAAGYLVKSAAPAELVRAIRTVMEGSVYLSPDIANVALDGMPASALGAEPHLGHRERQVLSLLAGGKRSSEIASALSISAATVEVHRRNIMRKLDLHSVAELTKYAIRQGLTSL